jgi:nucleotide-binding universal stress UspA family protein
MSATHISSITRPKSILVATDLNDLDFLLPVATEQAKTTGAMIWLLHVIPLDAYVSIESGEFPGVSKEKEKAFRDAEAMLADIASQLTAKNVACAYAVRRWYPVEEIVEFIRRHRIGRLIVGTSGRGKIGKLLVGSVAEELIRRLDIPVCTVGPHYRPCPPNSARRIIFALSLRHHPERSLQFARELARGLRAELILLHVTEPDRLDEGIDAGARSKIDEILKSAESLDLTPQVRIRSGEPAEEILAECAVLRPELLVLSAFPASPLRAKFRTGVAYRVIAQAPCPTITLRSGPKANSGGNYREFSQASIASSHSE